MTVEKLSGSNMLQENFGPDGDESVPSVVVGNLTMKYTVAYMILAEYCGLDIVIEQPMTSTLLRHPVMEEAVRWIRAHRVSCLSKGDGNGPTTIYHVPIRVSLHNHLYPNQIPSRY